MGQEIKGLKIIEGKAKDFLTKRAIKLLRKAPVWSDPTEFYKNSSSHCLRFLL